MVIQRNWRPIQQNCEQNIQNINTLSSEDSNSSCQINLISSKKFLSPSTSTSSSSPSSSTSTASSTADNVLAALKQRYGGRAQLAQNPLPPLENALKSLDLLRLNIQSIFDKEIESVLKKFIDMFFLPAIKNIKDNLGDNLFRNDDDELKKICLALLESSKRQYLKVESCKELNDKSDKNEIEIQSVVHLIPEIEVPLELTENKIKIETENDVQKTKVITYSSNFSLKRKEPSCAVDIHVTDITNKSQQQLYQHSQMNTTHQTQPQQQLQPQSKQQQMVQIPKIQQIIHVQNSSHQPPIKKFILPLSVESFQSPILTKQLLQETNPPPVPQSISTFHSIHNQHLSHQLSIARSSQVKPIIWNTSVVGSETQFVLDIKASRWLGLNENKDRLSMKHPELIRYMMDSHDKDWMIQQKLIPPNTKNLKYLILVKDEVLKLTETNLEYKICYNKNIQEFQSFKVSEFIIKKIQRFFHDLNYKSRFSFYDYSNLIPLYTTPSSTSAGISSTSASLVITSTATSSTQSTVQQNNSSSATTSNLLTVKQGNNIISQINSISNNSSQIGSSSSSGNNNSTNSLNVSNSNNNIGNNNSSSNNNKSRSSLSSTHATLSALLSNHSDTSTENDKEK